MDYGTQLLRRLTVIITAHILGCALASVGFWVLTGMAWKDDLPFQIVAWFISTLWLVIGAGMYAARIAFKPLKTLSDAIVFAGHSSRGGIAPDTEKLRLGRQMVTTLARQVYDLASMSTQSQEVIATGDTPKPTSAPTPALSPLDQIGLPLIGIDPQQNITVINPAACAYLAVEAASVLGKPLYDAAKLSFPSDETFEAWLKGIQQNAINSDRTWERVRTTDENGNAIKQFDLVAHFSKEHRSGTETMLALYDRTEAYSRDDQETSFVALAVHELRTPLTIMRGYIEVFEDEVGPQLSPELKGFMHKMQASAQQLTAFVGNILNVARVEENQLVLKLQEFDLAEILKGAVDDLALRAGVHGKHIELNIASGLPHVAADRISIHEVINNLVDNAIKYSENSDRIVISSAMNSDGLVETSVQDFGIGIPAAVMPDLFQKFYRSHKSSVQISGTGLGLYLCKAIVSAHGGNIWVRSKEGEGSIFSFTLQPFDQVKQEQTAGEDGIMRGAHGWIKNHSLNRQ